MKIHQLPPNPSKLHNYLSERERRNYSISRAILAAGQGGMSCLEREVSESFCRDAGLQAAVGCVIPPEILYGDGPTELRALNATNATAGGYLIGHQVGPLLNFLFPQSVIFRLGASFLPNITSSLSVPRVSSSDVAEWLPEGESPSGNHDSQFGSIQSSPKRVFARRTLSKQLIAQNPFGDELASRLIMGSVAAAIDHAALVGTGDVQPLGLMNDANVATVSSGTDGGAPTRAILNQTEGTPITNKVPLAAPGWVVSPNAREKLKGTQTASGTSSFLLETQNNLDHVNGFTAYPTASLRDDGTKGTGEDLGSAIFGADWSTLTVSLFGGLEIISDVYTEAQSGKVIVSLNAFLDITKQRTEAFAKVADMVTA